MFDFNPLKSKVGEVEEWLVKELSGVRTGRATPVILDSIVVEAYNSHMSIREVANVTIEDPKTIRIQPWDTGVSKAIEKAITASNLGLSTVVDDKGLRIIFPELTSERRAALAKLVGQKLEEARVSLRSIRDKTWDDIQKKEKEGGMGEDDKFRLKDEMQKIIDEGNRKLEAVANKKEVEISS